MIQKNYEAGANSSSPTLTTSPRKRRCRGLVAAAAVLAAMASTGVASATPTYYNVDAYAPGGLLTLNLTSSTTWEVAPAPASPGIARSVVTGTLTQDMYPVTLEDVKIVLPYMWARDTQASSGYLYSQYFGATYDQSLLRWTRSGLPAYSLASWFLDLLPATTTPFYLRTLTDTDLPLTNYTENGVLEPVSLAPGDQVPTWDVGDLAPGQSITPLTFDTRYQGGTYQVGNQWYSTSGYYGEWFIVTKTPPCAWNGGADSDGDGVIDNCDNCPSDANAGQEDADQDGVGDACGCSVTDTDTDGTPDPLDIAPCDPEIASVAFYPSCTSHGMLIFEDQWPAQGDYDFNDQVVTYNYAFYTNTAGAVKRLELTYNVLASGAGRPSGLGIALPVAASAVSSMTIDSGGTPQALANRPGESNVVVTLASDIFALYTPPAPWIKPNMVNTDPTRVVLTAAPVRFIVNFATPVALNTSPAPFDMFFFRTADQTWEIHQASYSGTSIMNTSKFNTAYDNSAPGRWFTDQSGVPAIMDVPVTAPWLKENQPIYTAYPDILPWGASGGQSNPNWWATNVNTSQLFVSGKNNVAPPSPQFVAPPVCAPSGTCTGISCGG